MSLTDIPFGGLIGDGLPAGVDAVYTDPARLFLGADSARSGQTPTLIRLLEAAGMDRGGMLLSGKASDYDIWDAICGAMPTLAGHPLYASAHAFLRSAFGWEAPLNRKTAASAWQHVSWVLSSGSMTITDLAARCGAAFLPACRPQNVLTEGMSANGRISDLSCLERALDRAVCTAGTVHVLWIMPDGYTFVRPHPYQADLLLKKAQRAAEGPGRPALDTQERSHLTGQLVRTLGRVCRERRMTLELYGQTDGLCPLLDYLDSAGCLPRTVCVLRGDQAGATAKESFMAWKRLLLPERDVSVSLLIRPEDTPAAMSQALQEYAAILPLGCMPGLRMQVHTPADLGQVPVLRRVLDGLLRRWETEGAGPVDPDAQAALTARVLGVSLPGGSG